MPVLANVKHERFANHIAGGMTQAEAYKSAGFTAKHLDSAASKLASRPEVKARIEELKRRITNRSIDAAVQRTAITKEVIMRELWENVERGKKVAGGSAVVNRGLELMGKELGMFRDPVDKPPVRLEDLPDEVLQKYLADADAAIARDKEAAAVQAGDGKPTTAVN